MFRTPYHKQIGIKGNIVDIFSFSAMGLLPNSLIFSISSLCVLSSSYKVACGAFHIRGGMLGYLVLKFYVDILLTT